MWSARTGHTATTTLLLDRGANVNLADNVSDSTDVPVWYCVSVFVCTCICACVCVCDLVLRSISSIEHEIG
jgi:hypothetical protein